MAIKSNPTRPPKEFVRPTRTGRSRGVNVSIDADTWEYMLEHSNIPFDAPLETLQIRRYATKSNRIILKVLYIPITKSDG